MTRLVNAQISEEQLAALKEMSERTQRPYSEFIRRGINLALREEQQEEREYTFFGDWLHQTIDNLKGDPKYLKKVQKGSGKELPLARKNHLQLFTAQAIAALNDPFPTHSDTHTQFLNFTGSGYRYRLLMEKYVWMRYFKDWRPFFDFRDYAVYVVQSYQALFEELYLVHPEGCWFIKNRFPFSTEEERADFKKKNLVYMNKNNEEIVQYSCLEKDFLVVSSGFGGSLHLEDIHLGQVGNSIASWYGLELDALFEMLQPDWMQ